MYLFNKGDISYVTKGCPKQQPKKFNWIFPQPRIFKYAVRCCSISDIPGTCISKDPQANNGGACLGKHTYDGALKVCKDKGMRMCQKAELDTHCCGTGCYDAEWVWVTDQGKLCLNGEKGNRI